MKLTRSEAKVKCQTKSFAKITQKKLFQKRRCVHWACSLVCTENGNMFTAFTFCTRVFCVCVCEIFAMNV